MVFDSRLCYIINCDGCNGVKRGGWRIARESKSKKGLTPVGGRGQHELEGGGKEGGGEGRLCVRLCVCAKLQAADKK